MLRLAGCFTTRSAAGALRAEAVLEERGPERVAVVPLDLDREPLHGAAAAQAAFEIARERVEIEAALRKALEDDDLASAPPLLAPHLDRLGAQLLRGRSRRRGRDGVGRSGRQR